MGQCYIGALYQPRCPAEAADSGCRSGQVAGRLPEAVSERVNFAIAHCTTCFDELRTIARFGKLLDINKTE